MAKPEPRQRTFYPTRRALFVTALTFLLVACGSPAADDTESGSDADGSAPAADVPSENLEQDEPASLTIASSQQSPSTATVYLWAAEALGYFDDEGLDVTIQNIDGSVAAARAVATGQVDYAVGTIEPVPQFVEQGDPLLVVSQYAYEPIYSLAFPASSDIDSVEELSGRRVGVVSAGSAAVPVLQFAVEANGLSASDVIIVPIGLGQQAVAAIEGGEVDALMFWDTAYLSFQEAGVALKGGNKPFYWMAEELKKGYPAVGVYLNADESDQLSDITPRLLRALAKAYVFSKANPPAAVDAMGRVEPLVLEQRELSIAGWEARMQLMDVPSEGQELIGFSREQDWMNLQDAMILAEILSEAQDFTDLFSDAYLEAANDFDRKAIEDEAAAAALP